MFRSPVDSAAKIVTFIHHKGRTKEKRKKHIKAHAEAHTQTQQY